MPIWIVAKYLFGSRASRTSVRYPSRSNERSCPSLSDTNAISLPANAALTKTRTATSARLKPYPSTRLG